MAGVDCASIGNDDYKLICNYGCGWSQICKHSEADTVTAAHVLVCVKHPMRKLEKDIRRLKSKVRQLKKQNRKLVDLASKSKP